MELWGIRWGKKQKEGDPDNPDLFFEDQNKKKPNLKHSFSFSALHCVWVKANTWRHKRLGKTGNPLKTLLYIMNFFVIVTTQLI